MVEERLDQMLARFERERLEADRLYHDALTALDRAIQAVPDPPAPAAPYDDHQITPINEAWNILPDGPPAADRSLAGRLRSLVWRVVGPPLEPHPASNETIDKLLDDALARLSPSRAAAEVAEQLNIPRKRAYARALELSRK